MIEIHYTTVSSVVTYTSPHWALRWRQVVPPERQCYDGLQLVGVANVTLNGQAYKS